MFVFRWSCETRTVVGMRGGLAWRAGLLGVVGAGALWQWSAMRPSTQRQRLQEWDALLGESSDWDTVRRRTQLMQQCKALWDGSCLW